MNTKLVITAVVLVLVVSMGTFYGLQTYAPYQPEEIKVGETAELADVLAGSMKPAAPSGEPTIIGTTEELKSAAQPPPESAPAPTAAPPEAEAEAPAAAAPATASPPTAAAPTPAAPASKPDTAGSTPAPASKPAPAAKPVAPVKPWWRGDLDGELSAVYVGSLAEKPAIVVMFNGSFKSADSLAQHTRISDAKGPVPGQWQLAAGNNRMAVYPVPKAGRYQLSLEAGLRDGSGKTMKATQQGPVDVQ
jgi:hypothetical protein